MIETKTNQALGSAYSFTSLTIRQTSSIMVKASSDPGEFIYSVVAAALNNACTTGEPYTSDSLRAEPPLHVLLELFGAIYEFTGLDTSPFENIIRNARAAALGKAEVSSPYKN
jgi:hypothetical protein